MLCSLLGLILSAPLVDAVPVYVDGEYCHPSRLLVKLRKPTVEASFAKTGVRVLRRVPEIGWTIVEVPPGRLQQTRRSLSSLPGVADVELDRAAQPAYNPNDAMWPDMWHMKAIKADLAWDHSFGSSDITVAVIDTGVLTTHPDLEANIWHNAGEIPGNGIDDDGNGYIDDIVGYDFAYGDNNPNDVYGHGTACAGLVAAVQDNTIGVTGVAPRAKIMALKACNDSGYFYDSMTVPAYMYAAHMGAKVLSMSYFSDHVSQAERDAIDYCWNHDVLPVAAAGNSASVIPYYPGAYENTLSVAAVGTNLLKAGFSDYGTWVDVSAPGTNLLTTTNSGGYTTGFGGTSGATPHVAGLAALLFGARIGVSAPVVRNAIEDTATAISQQPYGEFSNYGLINCEAAMLAILNGPAPARSPVVRYISELGGQITDTLYPEDISIVTRIYGRGFQAPRSVEVTFGGVVLPIVRQTRDFVDVVYEPPIFPPVVVKVDGQTISTFNAPIVYRRCWPLVEASSPNAQVIGGFFDTLKSDSAYLRCTRQSDGVISMQGTIRKVDFSKRCRLWVKRSYTGSSGGTETVYLYDWSSGSYPYGNWVGLSSNPTPSANTLLTIDLPEFAKYIDPEGTMYVLIQTSNTMPSGAELHLDQLGLVERQ